MTNIDEIVEFEPFFEDGKCNFYTISEASQHALCRALLELQCAYQLVSEIEDTGLQPAKRVKKALEMIAELLAEVKNLSQEDTVKIDFVKGIVNNLCNEDFSRLSPDQATIIRLKVEDAYNLICDIYDYISEPAENNHLKKCKDELELADTLLSTIRNSGGVPIVRLRCALRIAEKQLATVSDLREKDLHQVQEIAKFLSVLPDPLILIQNGKSKQLKKAIIKAGRYLVSCVQNVFDKKKYEDTYYCVLFEFLGFPKSEEYKAAIGRQQNK